MPLHCKQLLILNADGWKVSCFLTVVFTFTYCLPLTPQLIKQILLDISSRDKSINDLARGRRSSLGLPAEVGFVPPTGAQVDFGTYRIRFHRLPGLRLSQHEACSTEVYKQKMKFKQQKKIARFMPNNFYRQHQTPLCTLSISYPSKRKLNSVA